MPAGRSAGLLPLDPEATVVLKPATEPADSEPLASPFVTSMPI
jgi:hypothetical protein